MKGSKLLIILCETVLILAFTVTTVAGQVELPPVGEEDEDGTLVLEGAPATSTAIQGERHDVSSYKPHWNDGITTQSMPPEPGTPISPVDEWVFTKTPKFWFRQWPAATRYRIELRNYWSENLVYTFTGAGDCDDVPDYCWLKTPTKLKTFEYFNPDNGDYIWRLGTKYDGKWYYSEYYNFVVLSNGFKSNFDLNLKKWYSVTGDWFRVDPGYLKTRGISEEYSSIFQKELFVGDFVYKVRMKGTTEGDQAQGIIVSGNPHPIGEPGLLWDDGFYYLYSGGKTGFLYVMNGMPQLWTGWITTDKVDPTGWNTLAVDFIHPYIYFYVNGSMDYDVMVNPDTGFAPGWVGVTHIKYTTGKATLLVDWANLSYKPFSISTLIPPDTSGAKVINLDNLPPITGQIPGPLVPPE